MFRNLVVCTVAVVIFLSFAGPAQAQVVREQGTGSIAGVLYKNVTGWQADEFTFWSYGNEILLADLDAELFRNPGSDGGGCALTAAPTASSGDCCSGDEGEGGGGQGQFTLTVFDSGGGEICKAGRPTRPGWERDPRIACHLVVAGEYRLQVGRGPMGHEPAMTTTAAESGPSKLVYLLNVSLRKVATSGPMIQSITGGRNLFPKQN